MARKKQISFYTDMLKEGEILLLKSRDTFFNNHYSTSPLALLTNFQGSEGEAIIDKNGKITIFVDTRYHILVDRQVFKDINVHKLNFGETFLEALENMFPKNTKLYLPDDIFLNEYYKYISKISNKNVKMYLLSLTKAKLKEVFVIQ